MIATRGRADSPGLPANGESRTPAPPQNEHRQEVEEKAQERPPRQEDSNNRPHSSRSLCTEHRSTQCAEKAEPWQPWASQNSNVTRSPPARPPPVPQAEPPA